MNIVELGAPLPQSARARRSVIARVTIRHLREAAKWSICSRWIGAIGPSFSPH
ncbi:MAG: hypothetical protein ACK5H2_06715 [Beutenbergiaceae bacterium]